MSEPLKIRRFASLKVPYESVRELLDRLVGDALGPCVHVHSVCHQQHSAGLPALTRVTVGYGRPADETGAAADMRSAEIYASALSNRETRLEVEGHWVGPGLDASVEREAEARLEALLEALVKRLRPDVAPAPHARQATATGPAERSR